MDSYLLNSIDNRLGNCDLSIIIPTYKRPVFLEDAIKSVVHQLSRTSLKCEVIVVNNDRQTDLSDLISKYESYPVYFYVNAENYGQVGNVNQGTRLACGKNICYLHDDDLLLPNYLPVVEQYLDKGCDCIIPEYYDFDSIYRFDWKHNFLRAISFFRVIYKKKIQMIDPDDYKNCFYNVYDAPTCGIIFSKSALEEYGYFKDERGASWDYYNLRHFNQSHTVYFLHECVAARRRYTGMTNTEKVQAEFKRDAQLLLEEIKDWPFIRKYYDCILNKKPLFKYIRFRIAQDAYVYLHNLERHRPIKRREFQWLKTNYNL